jgi:acetyl/propionyl-CoA carboxylase alpha subunit
MKYVTTILGKEHIVEILDEHTVVLDGKTYHVDFNRIGDQPVYSMLLDGRSVEAYVYPTDEEWQVLLDGHLYTARVEDEREVRLRAAIGGQVAERAEFQLKAPMPGLIVAVQVEEGQQVNKGDVLIILESMKMQNELRSARTGVVTRLRVKAKDSVEQKQVLLTVS